MKARHKQIMTLVLLQLGVVLTSLFWYGSFAFVMLVVIDMFVGIAFVSYLSYYVWEWLFRDGWS